MTIGKGKYIRQQTFMDSVSLDGDPKKDKLLRKEEAGLTLTSVGVQVRTFDLSVETDLSEYTELLDGAANKKLEMVFLSRHWDEESRSMRVYVEWRKYALTPKVP